MLDNALTAPGSDTALVRQGVSGLDLVDKQLTQRLADFIATGGDPAILLELRARHDDDGALLGNPGQLDWWIRTNAVVTDLRESAAANSVAGRHKLYQRVANDEAGVALLVRLGKALEAVDRGRLLGHTGAAMPDWLQYLLNDALWGALPGRRDENQQAERPAWDVTLLRALLAHDDYPAAMVLPIIFERKQLDGAFHKTLFARLLAPGALDDYMLAHGADVRATAAALSAAGRILLVNRIGASAALLAAFPDVVVRLAAADGRTVRAAAARYIDRLDKADGTAHIGALLRDGLTDEKVNAADLLARTQGEAALPVLEAALAAESSKPVQQAIRAAITRLGAADDAGALALPEPPPLPPAPAHRLADDAIDLLLANRAELLEQLRIGAEDEAEHNRSGKYTYKFQQEHYARYRKLSDNELRLALKALNGEGAASAIELFDKRDGSFASDRRRQGQSVGHAAVPAGDRP
nr:hypothetical protein [uncultured Duganella sp.]